MRLSALISPQIDVSLNGWQRQFQYWSGRAYWININSRAKELAHPDDLTRVFDESESRWYWKWTDNGAALLYANGDPMWDTYMVAY